MPISALDHIVLNVQDIERSLAFYQGCLGLAAERVEAWRAGTLPFPSLRINDATLIDLVKATQPATSPANLNHFCLVTDEEELTSIHEQLDRSHIQVEQGPAIRSGARGDAVSIYFRDPDHNLIEVRTYARRPMVRVAIDDMHAKLRSTIDTLEDPSAPVPGNETWTVKDLIAHLVSIETILIDSLEDVVRDPSSSSLAARDIQAFNDQAVAERRDWTLQQLKDELEQHAEHCSQLLERLDEPTLNRTYQHPTRGQITLAERCLFLTRHARTHLAEIPTPALATSRR